MQRKVNVFTLLLVMFLVSCPSIPKTPEGRFDEARARWNSTMREYRAQYALQDEATQQKWDGIFARPLYETGLTFTNLNKSQNTFIKRFIDGLDS